MLTFIFFFLLHVLEYDAPYEKGSKLPHPLLQLKEASVGIYGSKVRRQST